MRTFNAEDGTDERLAIITQFPSVYNAAFDSLHPLVAYLSAKNSDLEKLEKDAKDVAANLSAQAEIILETLTDKKTEAENALSEIRKVAGEQGISLQAKFFKIEADQHEIDSRKWQNYTVYTAVGLIIYAICALVFSICYSPADQYQSIQIGISKILIFAVISYMLILCSRTLMAHRHNFIVNRHRENALLTFTALAEAANSDDRRDIVLTHAAACIFDQQDTGYTKSGQNSVMPTTNIIEAIPRITQA